MDSYNSLKDEELVALSRNGDRNAEEALIVRYSSYVRSFTRPYFLVGGDSEDLIQEGLISVIKAISEFDETRCAKFGTFVSHCIRNRIYSAIRNAHGAKNSPLNDYISIDREDDDSSEYEGFLRIAASGTDPVEKLIGDEGYNELLSEVSKRLSGFEKKVLKVFLEGLSYTEISEVLSKPVKSVDNAIQRIRRKFAEYLEEKRGDIR